MTTPVTVGGVPTQITVPAGYDANTDLPAQTWPNMADQRITVTNLVGPTAANKQHRVLQKRSISLVDQVNKLAQAVRYAVGVDAVSGDWSRQANTVLSNVGSPSAMVQGTNFSDTDEHYLSRDGRTVHWGRFIFGNTRTLLYGTAFSDTAYPALDPVGYHWFHGPGSADPALADADLAFGIQRLGLKNYQLHVYAGGAQKRVLNEDDLPGGSGGYMQVGSSNRRLYADSTMVELGVENQHGSTGVSRLSTTITSQDTFYLEAAKGSTGRFDIGRVGGIGVFMRAEGMHNTVPTTSNWWLRTAPLSVTVDMAAHGIALGHVPHGTPAGWAAADWAHCIQLPYTEDLRIAFGAQDVAHFAGDDASGYGLLMQTGYGISVANGKVKINIAPLSAISNSAYSDGHLWLSSYASAPSGDPYPRIGFERGTQNAAAICYKGVVSTVHEFWVRGSDGFSDRFTYKSELDLKAPLASPALTGVPTAPTAAPGTNTTQLATTAFVQSASTTLNKIRTSRATGLYYSVYRTTAPLGSFSHARTLRVYDRNLANAVGTHARWSFGAPQVLGPRHVNGDDRTVEIFPFETSSADGSVGAHSHLIRADSTATDVAGAYEPCHLFAYIYETTPVINHGGVAITFMSLGFQLGATTDDVVSCTLAVRVSAQNGTDSFSLMRVLGTTYGPPGGNTAVEAAQLVTLTPGGAAVELFYWAEAAGLTITVSFATSVDAGRRVGDLSVNISSTGFNTVYDFSMTSLCEISETAYTTNPV